MLALLAKVDLNQKQFDLRSLESRGAATTDKDTMRSFKRNGKWKGDKVNYGYVEDHQRQTLPVSLNLEL